MRRRGLFIQELDERQAAFARLDMPPAFVDDFRALVNELQRAQDVRLSSRTVRRQALAGIEAELEQGMDAARDLDAMVAIATDGDPATYAAWTSARRIEGLRSRADAEKRPPGDAPVVTPPAAAPQPPVHPLPEVSKAA